MCIIYCPQLSMDVSHVKIGKNEEAMQIITRLKVLELAKLTIHAYGF